MMMVLTMIGEFLTETTHAMTSTIHWGLITTRSRKNSLSKYCTVPKSCRKFTALFVCIFIAKLMNNKEQIIQQIMIDGAEIQVWSGCNWVSLFT